MRCVIGFTINEDIYPQYDVPVAIDLSSKLYWSKLISILFKIRDVVYVQITNISLASRLKCRSRSLTAVTSHRLASEIRRTLSSVIIMHLKFLNGLHSPGPVSSDNVPHSSTDLTK